jgi:acyl-CoA thioesterase-1
VRRYRIPLLLMLGLLAAPGLPARSVAAPPAARVIRILPLGDSITQGGRRDRPEYTYRYPLYYLLRDAGYRVDFIGSLKTGLQPEAAWPAKNGVPFDPDHEGHYGWKTGQVRDHLAEWMKTYPAPPDIVLIHLGTNDQGAANFDEAVVQPLREIIAMLRAQTPRVVVLVSHLSFNGGAALKIRPLVEQMAREVSTPRSPVRTVAMYEGWHEKPDEPGSDTFDWAHPNEQGQRKMAEKWLAAMKPYLDRLKVKP